MTLHLDLGAMVAFVLVLVRGTAFLITCPPFSSTSIPITLKTVIAAGLAVGSIDLVAHQALPVSTSGLIGALVVQIVIGALMGFVVQLFVGSLQGAGILIDQFSGLNLPPSIDPLGLDQSPLLGQLYEWLATVLLFSTGAILLLIRGFQRSFSVIGTKIPTAEVARLPSVIAADAANFFAASVEIAAPLVAVLIVAQLLLGLLAKAAPQTNVYALGFALQILLTLLVLTVAVAATPSDVANLAGRAIGQLFGGG